jgi:serine/threonine-protein kinase
MAQMLIRGGSLEDRIKRERRLSVEAAVSICMQVASGLDAIHAAGLIHRDVKPANILLDEQGIAYITDFGLCKDTARSVLLSRSGEKPAPSELTRPGQALGSLDYISPEQIRAEAVGPAADVYGLGCVMFAALTGEPPFADRQGMTVLWAHLQDDPPDLCAERPELPAEFGAAILRALAKDSAERPQSAGEYARAVAAAAGVA